MSLSDRIRPDSEAAPWVVKEVIQLEHLLTESLWAIREALKITDLWTMTHEEAEDSREEGESLWMMEQNFISIINKANKEKI